MEQGILEQIPQLMQDYGIGGTVAILLGGGYYKWTEKRIQKLEATIEELEDRLKSSSEELKEFGEKYLQHLEEAQKEKEVLMERLIVASHKS